MNEDYEKILQAVESLVSGDFAEDLEFHVSKGRATVREAEASKIITTIYKLAHSRTDHSCHAVHNDWREETEHLLTPTPCQVKKK